jgi:hypothetical protein
MNRRLARRAASAVLVPTLLLAVSPFAFAQQLPRAGSPDGPPVPPIGALPTPGPGPNPGPVGPGAPTGSTFCTSVQPTDDVLNIGAPVQVPATQPVVVTVLNDQLFANANNVSTPVNLPQGNWSKVVLTIHGTQHGVQYDRLMQVWAGDTQIFTGVTPEPTQAGISWTVQKNITRYLPVLMGQTTMTNEIDNYPSSVYNGIPDVSETLAFYPAAGPATPPAPAPAPSSPVPGPASATTTSSVYGQPPALAAINSQGPGGPSGPLTGYDNGVPSSVVPLQSSPGMDTLQAGGVFTSTVDLPHDITGARLDLYLIPQIGEEFWWGNTPAFREIEVSVDGKPAGVVWPFPYIYTGGVNPLFWQPLTGIHTLDIPSYELNLTPFAGVLGGKNTITLTVQGNTGYWLVSGSLLLDRMAGVTTTGAITQDTLTFPETAPEVTTTAPGSGNSLVTQSAARNFTIAGTITTPQGTWTSTVNQSMQFTNDQTNTTANCWGLVHAVQVVNRTSTLSGPGVPLITHEAQDMYTLDVADAYIQGTGGAFLLPGNVTQTLQQNRSISAGGQSQFHSGLLETLQSYAALQIGPNAEQYSSTGYATYRNSLGQVFRHTIVTNQGALLEDEVSGTMGA